MRALPLVPTLVSAAALAACGQSSDKDRIVKVITEGGRRPASICRHLDAPALARLGGRAGCLKASRAPDAKDPHVRVDSVVVSGDRATAKITGRSGPDTVRLVKRDGDWKISGG